MSKRRRLDREGLEVYLLNLLLAYRILFRVCGVLLLVYGVVTLSLSPVAAGVVLVFSVFLILLSTSYPFTLAIARFGAWLGTAMKRDE